MKIAILSASDATDRNTWSGTHFFSSSALKEQGHELVFLGPAQFFTYKVLRRVLKRLYHIFHCPFNTRSDYSKNLILSWVLGRYFSRKIKQCRPDLIYAPAASLELGFLKTNVPIIYLSDATFKLIQGYYPETSNLSFLSRFEGEFLEKRALKKASLCIPPSEWAAHSMINDYKVASSLVSVIPLGANIDSVPDKALIEPKLKDRSVCKLLFLGKDWARKGGDIVIETVQLLNAMDIKVELTICGCELPEKYQLLPIKHISYLDKNNPTDFETFKRLLSESHFLFLPTRAECFGLVFCEASAYGVPSITTHTGGVPTVVKEGVNGYCLPETASAEDYAACIKTVFSNELRYKELVYSSRQRFDTVLNWNAWSKNVLHFFTNFT